MTDKCEICSTLIELEKVSACACDEKSPHAFLCKQCKKKYFDYMLAGPSGIFGYLPSVPYFNNWSYAENLVYAYNVRFDRTRKKHEEYTGPIWAEKKEATTMQVSYKGFTGELVKLERRSQVGLCSVSPMFNYDLAIYDSEKQVTHSFAGVKLEDMTFLGGVVTLG